MYPTGMLILIIYYPEGHAKEGFNIFCSLEEIISDFVPIKVLVSTSDDPRNKWALLSLFSVHCKYIQL